MRRVFTEEDIRRQITCTMGVWQEDPLEKIAFKVLRWALQRAHDGEIPDPSVLRQRFLNSWNDNWGSEPRGTKYWKGAKATAGFARRLHELLRNYTVVQPMLPYDLILKTGTLRGQAAVLGRIRPRDRFDPFVLDPQ